MSVEFYAEPLPDFVRVGARMHAGMANAAKLWGLAYLSALVKTRLSGRPGLNRVTGNLQRDWIVDSTAGDEISVKVETQGVANAYAGIQERGGVIRPVKSKFLWIPTEANRTPSGAPRISPTEAIQRGGFINYKRGPVFFAKPMTKSTKKTLVTHGLVALFVLKKQVTIPARMGATALFRARLPGLTESMTKAAMEGWSA
jgi:hypothetical protein